MSPTSPQSQDRHAILALLKTHSYAEIAVATRRSEAAIRSYASGTRKIPAIVMDVLRLKGLLPPE